MIYCQIVSGIVVNRTAFDGPMPQGWAEPFAVWIEHDEAQIGWSYADGVFAPPPPEPLPDVPIEEQRAAARASIVAAIDSATAAILGAYPQAERLGWDAKASEAQLALTAGEAATLELAPLLVAECIAEHGPADEVTRLAQLIDKAATVAAKATAWGELMASLSGIRGRAFITIADANDAAAVQAALDAAVADIAAATMPH